jgi:hypothetical protein
MIGIRELVHTTPEDVFNSLCWDILMGEWVVPESGRSCSCQEAYKECLQSARSWDDQGTQETNARERGVQWRAYLANEVRSCVTYQDIFSLIQVPQTECTRIHCAAA